MKKFIDMLREFSSVLFGVFFLAFIIVSLVCLGKFLYCPTITKPVSDDSNIDKFSKTIERTMETGHFHILPDTGYSDDENSTMCLRCHGNFCHSNSEELRSFYNMHTFYIACETCHIRKKDGGKIVFQWFDDVTGEPLNKVKGNKGSYGAKIVPVKDGERLDNFPNKELAMQYMNLKDTYSEEKKRKTRDELMKHISKKPVTCEECHTKNGYLDLKYLGYDSRRINRLTQLSVLKLVDEYSEFYLPTMLYPGKKRSQTMEGKGN